MDMKILNKTLEYEGGLTNDANDAGGLTKYGISQAAYPNLDIANLTLDQAAQIYDVDYFHKTPAPFIQNAACLWKVFDIGVNQGVGTATKYVQRIIGTLPDGNFGPQSRAALTEFI
jgi:lysozyme family protein